MSLFQNGSLRASCFGHPPRSDSSRIRPANDRNVTQMIGGASDKRDKAAQQEVHEREEHGTDPPLGEKRPDLRPRWLRR